MKPATENQSIDLSSSASVEPLIVDTRPLFAQGQAPCDAIDDAVARLGPGQPLVLLVPFEPVPLYTKLGKLGFQPDAQQLPDGTWHIAFTRHP